MTSESDYYPSENEDEFFAEGPDTQGLVGSYSDEEEDDDSQERPFMEDEEDEDDDDDVSNFLNDVGDPLAAIEGLDTSDNAFANFVKQKRKKQNRRSSRLCTDKGKAPMIEHNTQTSEEEMMLEDESDEEEMMKEDVWSDALAEKFGLTPAMSRRAQKRRQQAKIKKLKQGKVIRDRSGMPAAASEKLGQGNLLYATKNYQEAAKLFMDAIRIAPQFPDAYQSLGMLYETVGDNSKSLNFHLFAAHLTRKDKESWKRVAALSKEQGLLRQAIYCINQVIRREKDDAEWRYERGLLFGELGEARRALQDLEYFKGLHPNHPEVIKHMTRFHYQLGHVEDAKNVISDFIQQNPENADLTHVNLLAELFVNLSSWNEVLALMERAKDMVEDPGDMPMDLECKRAIAFAHLGNIQEAVHVANKLLDQPVSLFADLYHLIASEFESMGLIQYAEPFLKALAFEPKIGTPPIWSRYAHAKQQIEGSGNGALHAWEAITKSLDPSRVDYIDAIVELAKAYTEAGDTQKAHNCLNHLEDASPFPPGLMFVEESMYIHRAMILKDCNRDDLFCKFFYNPVLKTLHMILKASESKSKGKSQKEGHIEDMDFFIWKTSHERRRKSSKKKERLEGMDIDGVEDIDLEDGFEDDDEDIPVLEHLLNNESNYEVLVQLAKSLINLKRFRDAKKVTQLAVDVLGKKQLNRKRRDTMRIYLADASCHLGELSDALKNIKNPIYRWPDSPLVWNIFTRIILGVGSIRQTAKFIAPLRSRFPESVPLALIQGHVHLHNRAYDKAMKDYMDAFIKSPREPITLLCLSNLFANYACSRNLEDRDNAVVQAFAWMQEYSRYCNDKVEAAYNAGRLAHQLSLMHLAVPLYREALQIAEDRKLPDVSSLHVNEGTPNGEGGDGRTRNNLQTDDPRIAKFVSSLERQDTKGWISDHSDLSREAAFNLSLILRESGAYQLAKEVMKKYLTF